MPERIGSGESKWIVVCDECYGPQSGKVADVEPPPAEHCELCGAKLDGSGHAVLVKTFRKVT